MQKGESDREICGLSSFEATAKRSEGLPLRGICSMRSRNREYTLNVGA